MSVMFGISSGDVGQALHRQGRGRIAVRVPHRGGAMRATTCEPTLATDAQVAMTNEQKELVKSLKDKSKRVKKLAKQIAKVPAEKKIELALEMKEMIAKVNSENDQLLRLAFAMAEAGYEDPDSDSSCDEDTADQVLAATSGGMVQLLKLQKGQVDVCTGKACSSRGGSEHILDSLTSHFQGSPKVTVQQCSCMGMCKQATNVSMREKDVKTVISELKPDMLSEHGVSVRELELAA